MNRIILFDFDNTLIKSDACVRIIDAEGNEKACFYDDSFRDYAIFPGEHLDFSDMESLEILKTARLTPLWDTMLCYMQEGESVVILTSREHESVVRDFMIERGVVPLGIEAVNAPKYNKYKNLTNAEKKKKVVEEMYLKGVREFIYYDDDIANIEAILSIKGPHIITHLVK